MVMNELTVHIIYYQMYFYSIFFFLHASKCFLIETSEQSLNHIIVPAIRVFSAYQGPFYDKFTM